MGKKVLIIDDEAYIRLLIEQALEELDDGGVEILSADNGLDGLALIKSEHPDLVFLDVMMPKMNGFDVCYKVKRELALEKPTIVMLTAKGQEYDRQKGEEAGVDLYMTKPFDPDQLLELAQHILEKADS